MPITQWSAAADGRYWIDVALANQPIHVMIDLGLVDPLDRVGFELEPSDYDLLKRAGKLTRFRRRSRRDASGSISWSETGMTTCQLLDAVSKWPVGPAVSIYVSCGSLGVPSRVGLVFFHKLLGCRVIWGLDQRIWSIEYP
jgi:hypothetical protein